MNRKILFVDDDSNILQGYKRILRKDFDIYLAAGGEEAIEAIANNGNFAVIVSDMRMPEMDGVEFLAIAGELAPSSVRVMLTGDAGQQTAMDAVNEGMVFRFLTKPCSIESIVKVLNAAIEQHLLITAEKQLLEETLGQSLEVMVNILAMVNPAAFSRSARIKQLAHEVATALEMKNVWEIGIAAMLSQIGCVTVSEEIMSKITGCVPLSATELNFYHRHPQIGGDLIAKIPRMKKVADIIEHQNFRLSDYQLNGKMFLNGETIKSAQLLKVVLDFDKLLALGNSPHEAFRELSAHRDWYDESVLQKIENMLDEKVEEYRVESIRVEDLQPGMVIAEDLWYADGSSVFEKGQKLDSFSMSSLQNYADEGFIAPKLAVKIPIKRKLEESFSLIIGNVHKMAQNAGRPF